MVQLVVDDMQVDGLGNTGVYDMIEFNSGTLLVGINNIIRIYNRNLLLNIGPYPMGTGTVRSVHWLTIRALPFPQFPEAAEVEQSFQLTISY